MCGFVDDEAIEAIDTDMLTSGMHVREARYTHTHRLYIHTHTHVDDESIEAIDTDMFASESQGMHVREARYTHTQAIYTDTHTHMTSD